MKKIILTWPFATSSIRHIFPEKDGYEVSVITKKQEFYQEYIMGNNVEANLKNLGLVIFPGGEDVDPTIYGAENLYSYPNRARDVLEKDVLDYMLSYMPNTKILGICRGHQLINVMMGGGNLVQDITMQADSFNLSGRHPGEHVIEKTYGFATCFKYVNSMHHQGVVKTGRGLTPTSYFGGLIESAENDRIITTQFHPEFMDDTQSEEFWARIKAWIGQRKPSSSNNKKINVRSDAYKSVDFTDNPIISNIF